MRITTVKSNFEPRLLSLARNSELVSAASPSFQPVISRPGEKSAPVELGLPLVASSHLPPGIALPKTKETGKTDFETLKIIAQELILPCVSTIWPVTKPYVTGVQAVWATAEFWDAITNDEVDATKRTIKGVRAAQKAVNALLTFQGAPAFATNTNMVAGLMIATADKLYVVRKSAQEQ